MIEAVSPEPDYKSESHRDRRHDHALFEFGAAVCLCGNVAKLRRDKMVRGSCVSSTVFFTLWGYWNVWFYPSNGFMLSFVAGLLVVAANTAWVGLVIRYAPIGTRSVLYGVHAFWLHPSSSR